MDSVQKRNKQAFALGAIIHALIVFYWLRNYVPTDILLPVIIIYSLFGIGRMSSDKNVLQGISVIHAFSGVLLPLSLLWYLTRNQSEIKYELVRVISDYGPVIKRHTEKLGYIILDTPAEYNQYVVVGERAFVIETIVHRKDLCSILLLGQEISKESATVLKDVFVY